MEYHGVISECIKRLQPQGPVANHDALQSRTNRALATILSDIATCAQSAEHLVAIAPHLGSLKLVVEATVQHKNKPHDEDAELPQPFVLWKTAEPPGPPRLSPPPLPAAITAARRAAPLVVGVPEVPELSGGTDPDGRISSEANSEESPLMPQLLPLTPVKTFSYQVAVKCLRYVLDGCGATRHKQRGVKLGYDNVTRADVYTAIRKILIEKRQRQRNTSLSLDDILPTAFRDKSLQLRAPKIGAILDSFSDTAPIQSYCTAYLQGGKWMSSKKDDCFLLLCVLCENPEEDGMEEKVLNLYAVEGLGITGCERYGPRCPGPFCSAIGGQYRATATVADNCVQSSI